MPASTIPTAAALNELLLIVRSARVRVEEGEAPDFETAIEGVIVDLLTTRGAPPATGSAYANGAIWIGS